MSHVTQLFQTNSKFIMLNMADTSKTFLFLMDSLKKHFLQLKPHFIEKFYLQVFAIDLLSANVHIDLLFFILLHSLQNDLK